MKKKDDKTNTMTSALYYFSAVCFYIASIFNLMDKNNSMGIVHLFLGSTFLCLGSVYLNQNKNKK